MYFRPVVGTLLRFGVPGGATRYKLVSRVGVPGHQRTEREAGGNGTNVPRLAEQKFRESLARARGRVYELGMCNEWEWFCTFTLDAAKYDRFALDKWRADFAQWLRNQRRLHGGELRYLLIPERHKDGAWHMHGMMSGVPEAELSPFVRGVHPERLVRSGYLNWQRCADRFGFVSLGRIRSREAAAAYVLKYIGKGLQSRACDVGQHLYFASRGLRGAEVVASGEFAVPVRRLPDYAGDWCSIWWFEDVRNVVFVAAAPAAGLLPVAAASPPAVADIQTAQMAF